MDDQSSDFRDGIFAGLAAYLIWGFLPVYFDATYDLNRTAKYTLVNGDLTTPAYVGWLASLGASLFGDALVLRFTLDGPFQKPDEENKNNFLNYPHLQGLFAVQPGLIPGFSFDVGYDKILIREFADLIDAEGSLVRARVNYHTGPAVISLFSRAARRVAIHWGMNSATMSLVSMMSTREMLLPILTSTGRCRGIPPSKTPL